MAQYIDKDAVVKELEKRIKKLKDIHFDTVTSYAREISGLERLLSFLDTLETKELEEHEQPEYSCFETVYRCGKKPLWNPGDTLACYELDLNGEEDEYVFGKVDKVIFDQDDWFYIFDNGNIFKEQILLEEETYKII